MPVSADNLTAKGLRSRAKIVDAAARLVLANGAHGATMEAIQQEAGVSASQLYHYFDNKRDLLAAVIQASTEVVLANKWLRDMRSLADLRAWRDAVVDAARETGCRTGCPLASFVEDIPDTDPDLLDLAAAGLRRLTSVVTDALTTMRAAGELRADADVHRLALVIVTAYEGGMLVSRAQRDPAPLEAALDAAVAGVLAHAPSEEPRAAPSG
ncbi:TetR/AcrR family transcriptional regulator [Nocardia bovistercoris]|uniref:TetR/AcrR family transcriptional regulator n=1 Tax=Nocardia bovistercoris TaxID=2785916 RepID=A0A931IJV3_9NOCA|nr:TetR/AcrR family transcriptional regulator [Nocardia bovistercoris]MBH0780903.1 TetR/AcrR family transcriptional regulator [Nocardia bovistercoris]